MGSALLKDILREIKKSLGRFLSILLIVGLGGALYFFVLPKYLKASGKKI